MRNALKALLVIMGLLMMYAGVGLPKFGDNSAPAATHVSPHYIENAYSDAHTPNIVTVMIADYRSFDTFGEVVVVFTAGMVCFLLLRPARRQRASEGDGR